MLLIAWLLNTSSKMNNNLYQQNTEAALLTLSASLTLKWKCEHSTRINILGNIPLNMKRDSNNFLPGRGAERLDQE